MTINSAPLADRMRPKTLQDVIGQSHLLEEGRYLSRMIATGMPVSLILYGPPGVGKTTIGMAMAGTFNIPFHYISAVKDGKKDLEKAVAKASPDEPVLVFVDEAHRFNAVQQDFLKPFSESGAAIVIMASTENPFHSIDHALRSRMRTLELKKLSVEQLNVGLIRALHDKENGLGNMNIDFSKEAMEYTSRMANGDMRLALNSLDMAARSTPPESDGKIIVDLRVMEECIQSTSFHDKKGDQYYDVLSALQRSINGSHVDASLHYAARLLEAGELDMLMRRLVVTAHEDMGLSAPHIGPQVITTWQGLEMIGMPEGRILVAKLIVQMCLAPKSNSAYVAMDKALEDIRAGFIGTIPKHLRDSSYASAAYLNNGVDYKYPHDTPWAEFGGYVKQQYMPDEMQKRKYYTPIEAGDEITMAKWYHAIGRIQ
ncbi:Replication-associated recombination protein A [compost metagenome]